ncbi:hypothetical protein [Vibrio owensii]|uniref:hypothetical protein n=1 Tax=Vibrio owensii TaxID=696485 RepID=UPI003CC5020B
MFNLLISFYAIGFILCILFWGQHAYEKNSVIRMVLSTFEYKVVTVIVGVVSVLLSLPICAFLFLQLQKGDPNAWMHLGLLLLPIFAAILGLVKEKLQSKVAPPKTIG